MSTNRWYVVPFPSQLNGTTMGEAVRGGQRIDHHDESGAAAIARITDKRDFRNHALAYCAVNTLLVATWPASGAGYFWPIRPIAE